MHDLFKENSYPNTSLGLGITRLLTVQDTPYSRLTTQEEAFLVNAELKKTKVTYLLMTCFPNGITHHFQEHWQWPATNKIHPSTGYRNCHVQHRPAHDTCILTVPDLRLLL